MQDNDPEYKLDYETPAEAKHRRDGEKLFRFFVWTFQKLLFASGVAMLAGGLGDTIRQASSGPEHMAIGAFLASLAIPLSRREEK